MCSEADVVAAVADAAAAVDIVVVVDKRPSTTIFSHSF